MLADARVESRGKKISNNRFCVSQSQQEKLSMNKERLIHYIKNILSDKCQADEDYRKKGF